MTTTTLSPDRGSAAFITNRRYDRQNRSIVMECDGDRLDRQDAWDRDHPDAEDHRERLAARIRLGDRVKPSHAWLQSCGIIDEGIISDLTGIVVKIDEAHPHVWRRVTLDNGRRSLDTNLVRVEDLSRELF